MDPDPGSGKNLSWIQGVKNAPDSHHWYLYLSGSVSDPEPDPHLIAAWIWIQEVSKMKRNTG
jgi:hypothetical protein